MSIELVHITVDCGDAGLGAAVVHEKQEWGAHWRTPTDPEGNEFCVVATAADDPAESAQDPAPA
jgi:hypothetical protein